MGLVPVQQNGNYFQQYHFPVNTFPGKVSLQLDRRNLRPGLDFIIDAGSTSSQIKGEVKVVELSAIGDSSEFAKLRGGFDKTVIYLLRNSDTLCKRLGIRPSGFAKYLPKGCYIIPQHGKLTWTVSTEQLLSTVFYVEDTAIPKGVSKAVINVQARFIEHDKNHNIIGMVPGKIKDSFIVFSAHYDHLGMMGRNAMFPGASDNASGTAMLLYLAHYFAEHQQRYNMVFIFFSGEEAGLKGSEYFVKHPLIPLNSIRFLSNLDIMGDASDGVTVVNATQFPEEFATLKEINSTGNYIPTIKSRGRAANSDHYHFSESGVPAFFIYTNGGKGYYHDVFDKADALSYNNIDGLAKLLIDFVVQL